MQTLTISRTGGRSTYTLAPTRNTGELQMKFAKCNGKHRKASIRDLRSKSDFPKFEAGMSTAEYVRAYGGSVPLKTWKWEQLSEDPCTLYTGADTCETLPEQFASWADFDAAQCAETAPESTHAAANDDAAPIAPDPEPAAPSAAVAAAVDRAMVERFGVSDPDACAHLPGAAAEIERIQSEAAAPVAAPVEIGPAEVAPPGYAYPAPLATHTVPLPADTAPPSYDLARLRRVHDKINATRATTANKAGQRWVRVMNDIRTLMHAHPDNRPWDPARDVPDEWKDPAAFTESDWPADAVPPVPPATQPSTAEHYSAGAERADAIGNHRRADVLRELAADAEPVPTQPDSAPLPGKSDDDAAADARQAERERQNAASLASGLARFKPGDIVTAEPARYFDGSPVAGWPNAQFLGTVRDISENTGVAYARVKWNSGRTDRAAVDRLEMAPLPGKSEPAADVGPLPGDTFTLQDAHFAHSIAQTNADAVSAACGGVPRPDLLKSQAERIARSAEQMEAGGLPGIAACYRFAASSLEAMARVYAMPPIDAFDYLADFTDAEPRTDASKQPSAMRAAVLADIARTGPDVFRDRIAEQRGEVDDDDETIPAPLDGLDVAELGDDGMAEFERAGGITKHAAPFYVMLDHEQSADECATIEAARASGRRILAREPLSCSVSIHDADGNWVEDVGDNFAQTMPTPCLRIPAGDPRIRIPARFAPVYLMQA